jgi:hypothetical protein
MQTANGKKTRTKAMVAASRHSNLPSSTLRDSPTLLTRVRLSLRQSLLRLPWPIPRMLLLLLLCLLCLLLLLLVVHRIAARIVPRRTRDTLLVRRGLVLAHGWLLRLLLGASVDGDGVSRLRGRASG